MALLGTLYVSAWPSFLRNGFACVPRCLPGRWGLQGPCPARGHSHTRSLLLCARHHVSGWKLLFIECSVHFSNADGPFSFIPGKRLVLPCPLLWGCQREMCYVSSPCSSSVLSFPLVHLLSPFSVLPRSSDQSSKLWPQPWLRPGLCQTSQVRNFGYWYLFVLKIVWCLYHTDVFVFVFVFSLWIVILVLLPCRFAAGRSCQSRSLTCSLWLLLWFHWVPCGVVAVLGFGLWVGCFGHRIWDASARNHLRWDAESSSWSTCTCRGATRLGTPSSKRERHGPWVVRAWRLLLVRAHCSPVSLSCGVSPRVASYPGKRGLLWDLQHSWSWPLFLLPTWKGCWRESSGKGEANTLFPPVPECTGPAPNPPLFVLYVVWVRKARCPCLSLEAGMDLLCCSLTSPPCVQGPSLPLSSVAASPWSLSPWGRELSGAFPPWTLHLFIWSLSPG